MKHVELYEAYWKNTDPNVDLTNKNEIEDILKEMKHDLDDFEYEIIVGEFTNESYNIKYHMMNTLAFSNSGLYDNKKTEIIVKIKESQQNLENLNKYMQLSYDLMKRLNNMGYEIAYFNTGHEYVRGLPEQAIQTDIRISRK